MKKLNVIPYITFGSIAVCFGFSVYILMPLGLLQMNFSLLLNVFFAILLGMLAGITIVAMNVQVILERILVYVLFFWEKRSMQILVRKNLMAHRRRNKMTSITYALTLGSIIFLLVGSTLTISQSLTINKIGEHADVYLKGEHPDKYRNFTKFLLSSDTDPVLIKNKDKIRDFAYVADDLAKVQNTRVELKFSGHARFEDGLERGIRVQGLQVSTLIDDSFDPYYQDPDTGLSISEQLYTARGSQSVGTGVETADLSSVDPSKYWETLLL